MSEPARIIVTIVVLVVMFVGLIGTVLPVVPGAILILLAALAYAALDGFHSIGWPTLVVLGLLTLLSAGADVWVSSVGAKMGGASGWSIVAGLIGGAAGLLLLSLPGAILGAVAGVLLVEIIRLRSWQQALKAGGGWIVGWLLSAVVRAGLALVMIVIFVWKLF